ncbi:hypothetical protein RFI_34291, partial [Reticulomyxa filosa]
MEPTAMKEENVDNVRSKKTTDHIESWQSHQLFSNNKDKDWKGYFITYFIPSCGGINSDYPKWNINTFPSLSWVDIAKQAQSSLPKCIEATIVWYDTCDFVEEGISEEKVHELLQQ